MTFILTHKSLRPSARALANALEERLGVGVPLYYESADRQKRHENFIRWGNSSQIQNEDTRYNSAELIHTSANKLRFSKRMISLGIPCVEICIGLPSRFPVVIRKVLSGSGGEGIEICTSLQEFQQKYSHCAWSHWYDMDLELGVHIFEGEVMKIFKKVRSDGLPEEKYPIRNLSRGYKFGRVNIDKYPKLVAAIRDYYSKFPIAFGRLDIGWDKKEKLYRVIEMNSGPGIATNSDTLNAYVDRLEAVIRKMK